VIRDVLVAAAVDVVFLAGYMKKLGPVVLGAFQGRILNTHPALLPKFGGRGMYGDRVFEAVLEAGEAESGVSIHLVDPEYDTGPVVRQCKVPALRDDSSTISRRAYAHERRNSSSKRLPPSPQVTFVSAQRLSHHGFSADGGGNL
jgi:phosphoribosylglycinamide formyltransferase-1